MIRTTGMGRSVAIKYTLEMVTQDAAGKLFECTPSEWRSRARNHVPGHGAPTEANLAKYVAGFQKSTQPGGANAHLGVQTVTRAKIVHQADRLVVAHYVPGMEVPPRG
jgi:hypothetical protein